jgi:hypothetical protein
MQRRHPAAMTKSLFAFNLFQIFYSLKSALPISFSIAQTNACGERPGHIPPQNILAKLANVEPRGRVYTTSCPLHPSTPAAIRLTREFGTSTFPVDQLSFCI